ncbi:class I SAM-dependent methyltransferase, partial [Streptomonospora algeriensis]
SKSRSLAATLDARGRETAAALKATRAELDAVRSRALPAVAQDLAKAVELQGRNDYEQQAAWIELREHLRPEAPFMPPLRGWAASPDVLRILVRAVERHRPELVVECGSGASSVWLGYALRRAGAGRLVALEHEERYAELSRHLVRDHGLEDVVEIRYAPLTDWTAPAEEDGAPRSRPWYDTAAVEDLHDIGLVFVDGPPEATARLARYPAVPVLIPRCAPDAVIVLDDVSRPGEREIAKRWITEFPELSAHDEPAEKGARVFTRKAL